MATHKSESVRTEVIPPKGLVPGVAHLALDVVDRGQSTTIAVLQDARTELRNLVEGGIELAEKTTASLFRFARKLTQRVDDGVAETLTSAERLFGGAVKAARETTRAATDLVHTAQAGVTGEKAVA
jgi:hypothetical protein